MIVPKFYLKDKFADEPTLISMKFKLNNKVFQFSTKNHILPDLWDLNVQRPLVYKLIPQAYKKAMPNLKVELMNIKAHLDRLSEFCIEEFNNLKRSHGSVDLSILKTRLKERTETKDIKLVERKSESLNKYIDRYIREVKENKRFIQLGKNAGQLYADSSVKALTEFRTLWNKYQKKHKVKNWGDIDDNFFKEFSGYLIQQDYSHNTIGKHVKNLKTFLSNALSEKVHSNQEFKKFPVYQTDITKVVLNDDEVNRLYNHTFEGDMQTDVDFFLIGCFTGLRYSDLKRISPNYIKQEGADLFINMINQKNKALPSIPIGGRLNKLLKKYNFHSPKTYSNRVNSNIKDACEMVGISQPIEVIKKKGGKVIIDFYQKNELVHVHTARRTAATNMYKSKLPMLLIMKITGHKKESSLLKYIVLDNDSTKEVLKGNSFFK